MLQRWMDGIAFKLSKKSLQLPTAWKSFLTVVIERPHYPASTEIKHLFSHNGVEEMSNYSPIILLLVDFRVLEKAVSY